MKLRQAKKIIQDVDRYGRHRPGTMVRAYLTCVKRGWEPNAAHNALVLYRIEGCVYV